MEQPRRHQGSMRLQRARSWKGNKGSPSVQAAYECSSEGDATLSTLEWLTGKCCL